MIKRFFSFFIISLYLCTSGFSVEAAPTPRPVSVKKTGNAATAGAYNATAISIFAWGIGLAVGIVVICLLLKSSHGHNSH